MKLYVDDIRNAPDDSWTVARTINAAMNAIDLMLPEEISLDHDISHQIEMGGLSRPYPSQDTFQAVAKYIALLYKLLAMESIYDGKDAWVPKVYLHTSNPVGAKSMARILIEAGITPVFRLTGPANRLEMEV